jgi:hypothetical protein
LHRLDGMAWDSMGRHGRQGQLPPPRDFPCLIPTRGCQTACKPGSVRVPSELEARDDHSSGTHLAVRLARPTRTAERECSCALRRGRPYSVLLPVGFAVPPLLPGARCALAAPFRPCPRDTSRHLARAVCFLWHFPWGRPRRRLSGTVFPWSPDFPLSPLGDSGRPAVWQWYRCAVRKAGARRRGRLERRASG